MATTRFKGETAGERLDLSGISDSDMIQLRHKPGTIDDADKGISKAQLLSCPFGVSDTAAATAAKAADLTNSNPDFTLVSGREVVVCFTTANTASNPTLNFAGSGAIPLYMPNGAAVSNWPADTWMHLKYFFATVGNTTIQRWILLSPIQSDTVAAGNMNLITSNAVATSNAMPVDEVTSGDMHSVTSNAVADAITKEVIVNNANTDVGNGKYSLFKAGNVIELDISGLRLAINSGNVLLVIPQAYRPLKDFLAVGYNGGGNYSTSNNLNFNIQTSGNVYLYTYVACSGNGTNLHATWII